jgi:GntR family transcriptional regulator
MPDPMYRQIADDLQSKIESGEIAPGTQLATEIDLREQYNASRNTVRDAIKWLITRGLVETRPGQGTYVIEKINPYVTTLTGDRASGGGDENVYIAEVESSHRKWEISDPRVEVQKATRVVARNLRIAEGAAVVTRHQQRFIDTLPWSLQTSYYDMTLVMAKGATRLLEATNIPEGTVSYLSKVCGITQAGYRDTIAVRAPDANEAWFFKLPADGRVSVFEIFRVGFDTDARRFRLTITVYPCDRNRLRIIVGDVPPREGEPAPEDDEPD